MQPLHAQPNSELANQYAAKYKNQDAVIKNSTTTVTFSFDKKEQTMSVNIASSLQILTLKANKNIIFGIEFNNNSRIARAKLLEGKFFQTCGDYRPEGIFHSDDKLCTYKFDSKNSGEIQTFVYEKDISDVRYYTKQYFTEQ